MEKKILINAFADEASSIIDNQIIAMKRNNLNGLEIRNADGISCVALNASEAKEIRRKLDDAGLQVGDVITEIDGVRLKTYTELLSEIDKHEAGDTVELKVYRYYDAEGNLTGSYEEYLFEVKLEMID